MRHLEREHQKTVICYLQIKYPFALFTIPPNGFKLPIGIAVQLKAMGYKAGSPDIMIFEPRMTFHGLFIEMKTPASPGQQKGVLKPEQRYWLEKLRVRGYKTAVCFGQEEACNVIDRYFEGGI
ncbi:MAG: VRR-NUC domain-containing protein [Nitrososphaerales archaeon]|jgi:hypothetical protein